MWISSRKPRAKKSSETSQLSPEHWSVSEHVEAKTTPAAGSDWKTTLPLDWTRMSLRKRKSKVLDSDASIARKCQDASSCRCKRHVRPRKTEKGTLMTHGRAIFCLHDLESTWLQGYFVPDGCSKPWGLLATLEDIDDCLACADGGYRRVTLTVYPKTTTFSTAEMRAKSMPSSVASTPREISGVEWTGGDMMNLYSPGCVEMTAEQLLTGEKALVIVRRYFPALVRQLHHECSVKQGGNILDLLPNVAVVKGAMSLAINRDGSQN